MTTQALQHGSQADTALALLLADGARAAAIAQNLLEDPATDTVTGVLAWCVRAMYALREGQAETGLQDLAQAQRLLDEAPTDRPADARAVDMVQHAQALACRREGRLADAEDALRRLVERQEQRSPLDAYMSTAALGIVLSMRGDYTQALDLFYQALALARRSGHDSVLVNALNNLGSYQSDLYNLEAAAPMLQECLAGALRLGSRRQTVYAAGNLVQCLCLMGQAAQALAVAREHLIGRIRPDDPPSMHRDEEIAQALLDNGLVDEAAATLGGQVHIDPLSNELATVRVWLVARVQLARGQPREALQLCLARQQMLGEEGVQDTAVADRLNLLRLAAQAAEQVQEHALAYRLLTQAFETHDRLLGRAARLQQLSLQITHRLRQAEWERDTAREVATRLETLNQSLQAQVAENERLQARLRAQALEDPLTGLYNRRHLMEAGASLLALLRRRTEPLAVALIDLDRFKQVNDSHGHDVGDRVLCAFADLARRELRSADLVCRHGGEEFALLLPGASAEQAAARLEVLLQRFGTLAFDGAEGLRFSCSFSAGVAVSGAAAESLATLLSRADAALYAAKQAGRARVLLAA